MGTGQCDLYRGTYGDNPNNIPDELKSSVRLPENDSQIKHIFRDDEGHLPDTLENRKLLVNLANDEFYHKGIDSNGLDWNVKLDDDGSQLWVCSRNGIIQNGGLNNPPREWNSTYGLRNNPLKRK